MCLQIQNFLIPNTWTDQSLQSAPSSYIYFWEAFILKKTFQLTLGNFVAWDHLLRLNTASFFCGMEIRGELSTSGSSSRKGCDGAAGIGTSSQESVADWLSAKSVLDWSTEATLSGTTVKATSCISPMLWVLERGVSLVGWELPVEKSVRDNINKTMLYSMQRWHRKI